MARRRTQGISRCSATRQARKKSVCFKLEQIRRRSASANKKRGSMLSFWCGFKTLEFCRRVQYSNMMNFTRTQNRRDVEASASSRHTPPKRVHTRYVIKACCRSSSSSTRSFNFPAFDFFQNPLYIYKAVFALDYWALNFEMSLQIGSKSRGRQKFLIQTRPRGGRGVGTPLRKEIYS